MQAEGAIKQTSSQAPLDGTNTNCAAPAMGDGADPPTAVIAAAHCAAPAGGDGVCSPAAVAAAMCIKANDICQAPSGVSAHLTLCTLCRAH